MKWIAPLGLLVVALVLCLRAIEVPWQPVWAWCFLSGVVILVLEAGLWERSRQEKRSRELVSRLLEEYGNMSYVKQVESKLERVRLEKEQLSRDTTQHLIGAALLVATAFGLALATHGKSTPSAQPSQMTILFSDGSEKYSGPNETTLRLRKDLEDGLLAYFKTQPGSAGGSRVGAVGLIIIIVALIIAQGVLLWWAVKRRPSVVPLIGAGDLAALVIKNVDHLSRPGGGYFWVAVYALLGIGILLLTAGAAQVMCQPNVREVADQTAASDGKQNNKDTFRDRIKGWFRGEAEPTMKESLLAVGLSALILVWALLLLAQPPSVQPPKPQPPIASPVIGSAIALRVQTFARRDSDNPSAIEELKGELREKAKEGDTVLLMGSTDCTSIRIGNKTLARKRASTVSDSLRNVVLGVDIQTPLLPQHVNCKGTTDLRAVYPFLIPLKRDEK